MRNDISLKAGGGKTRSEMRVRSDHPESFQTAEGLGLQCVVSADLDAVVMAQ